MRKAGIKVWMLTGDKLETAVTIGQSSGLLDEHLQNQMIQITALEQKDLRDQVSQALADVTENMTAIGKRQNSLLVTGEALTQIQTNEVVKDMFLNLVDKVDVVLACRVSPKQKAGIVNMIRLKYPEKSTLAIGDGANDVNMITSAHVGVGIKGLEGS
jgi:phospholipid-transporting ATPase